MEFRESEPLTPRTTFRIGGPAAFFVEVRDEADARDALAFASARGRALRALGGGSNLLVPDEGVDAVVARMDVRGIEFVEEGGATHLIAGAGEAWDDIVRAASARGLWGIENLAGIPGTAGGAAVQNIGAYGAELKDVFAYADVIERATGKSARLSLADAAFGYRESRFKRDRSLLIMRVALALSTTGAPRLEYADLARALESGVPLSTPAEVGEAVRAIRARKFPDLAVEGTAGSFFKNPVIPAEQADALARRYPELPAYPQAGRTKISLAWLLDRALSLKGFSVGAARLFENQPLVIVAGAGARMRDVDLLAREVEARVHEAFGIALEREVETFGA